MILQSLVRCYDSLAAQGTLKRPGWSAVKVAGVVGGNARRSKR